MNRVTYSSNNSGGYWWLEDKDWAELEKAGWEVSWKRDDKSEFGGADKDGRWMGALATDATRYGLSIRDAVDEWEEVTGLDAYDAGCNCCGQPHNFTEYDENDSYVSSGPKPTNRCEW